MRRTPRVAPKRPSGNQNQDMAKVASADVAGRGLGKALIVADPNSLTFNELMNLLEYTESDKLM